MRSSIASAGTIFVLNETTPDVTSVTSDLITCETQSENSSRVEQKAVPAVAGSPDEGIGQLRHTPIPLVMKVASGDVRAAVQLSEHGRTKTRFEDQSRTSR